MLGELEPAREVGPASESFALVGLSHRSAPLGVRERFAFEREAIPEALERLRAAGVGERLVLATCNRVEIYGAGGPAKALDEVLAWAGSRNGRGDASALVDLHAYRREGPDALLHLFRVAASLDSLVVGEDQILAQVKQAYDLASRAGALGPVLHAAFQGALRAGKRVRRETQIGETKLSVSSVAIDFVERIFADLPTKGVLLIGAGDAARLTLVHLREKGVGTIRIANRSVENAQRLAAELGGEAVPFEEIPAEVARADVVITSVGLPRPIVTAPIVSRALRERRGRPIFLLDIAVPRDVDPEVEKLEGAFLYNLDDLQRIVRENYERRTEDVSAATAIIADEVHRLAGRERHRALGPLVTAILDRAERAAREEVQDLVARSPDLTPDVRQALERMASRLVRRVLHEPLTAIRREARARDDDAVARLLARIIAESNPPQ
jgi:glutamyl-tRNA reductase